jgi:hypothetical protein
MGKLWDKIHDFFDKDDGTYPEICLCNLTPASIVNGYNFIRKNGGFLVGGPRFLNAEQGCEMGLDEVEDASQLVVNRKAHPFHFMIRNIRFEDYQIDEIGIFVLDNAIAIDYEKGPFWNEQKITSLMYLINLIMKDSPQSFIRLEEEVPKDDKQRFENAYKEYATT